MCKTFANALKIKDIGDLLYRNMAQIRKFLLCQFFILSGFPHFLP